MNIFPVYPLEGWTGMLLLAPALVVGFFFGLTLERAGFGNARVLSAQFYFTNMRVFKVMFTAIITAGAGMALLGAVGLLDMQMLSWPDTFIWPHLVGGFLLGAGFIVSGYCPGTSIVAAASGKLDGFATVLGVVVGSYLFGEAYGLIKGFYASGAKGVLTLHGLLGLPYAVLMAIVVLAAVGMFFGAEKVEAIFSARMKAEDRPRIRYPRKPLYAVAAVGLLAAAAALVFPPPADVRPWKTAGTMTPVELGQRIVEQPETLTIVDLRRKPDCEGPDRIPGAVCFEDLRDVVANLPQERDLVAYAHGPQKRLPPRLQDFPGKIYRLQGGLAGWKASIVDSPEKRADEIVKTQGREAYDLISSLHSYFTGARASAAPSAPPATIKRAAPKKGGGGCS